MAKISYGPLTNYKVEDIVVPPAPIYIDRPIFINRIVENTVDRIVEVIKHVDREVEVIKNVDKHIYIDRPVEIIKEIKVIEEKIVNVDRPITIEVIKEIKIIEEKIIEKFVHRVPSLVVGALASETVLLVLLLAHKLMS